jgi:hypothetical protein
MIHIPEVRRRQHNHWKIIALALLFVIFLAGSFLAAYYYVFGIKSPWQTKNYSRPSNIYVAPQYRLDNIIKSRFIK